MPSEQLLTDMMKFNEELVNAGVMLAGEGLHRVQKPNEYGFHGARELSSMDPFPKRRS
jgi:hypothetical protein